MTKTDEEIIKEAKEIIDNLRHFNQRDIELKGLLNCLTLESVHKKIKELII